MISCIIPVHNRPSLVQEAIRSLLSQSLPPDEILVIDDGSTDRTAACVDAFGGVVRRIFQENQGGAAARNTGVHAARGNMVAFLDSDDLMAGGALAMLHDYLMSHPECDLVYGQMVLFRDAPRPMEAEPLQNESEGAPLIGSLLCRREIVRKVGDFDVQLGAGEWIDWYSRAVQAGIRMAAVPHPVLLRRIHEGNLTTQRAATAPHYARMLAMHLKRRRSQAGE